MGIEDGWRFILHSGEAGQYRLAQLDNYDSLARRAFPHRSPLRLELQARASRNELPGTWGFGLWNDPFGFSFGFGSTPGRLPALPNAIWFFFASAENHLALRDYQPGHGALAAVIAAPRIPAPALLFGLPALPLLAWRPTARLLRKVAARVIRQDTVALDLDASEWHRYSLTWLQDEVTFEVDQAIAFHTTLAPRSPLALVLWIDNQFAAWRPNGSLANGTLATDTDAWIEVKNLQLK